MTATQKTPSTGFFAKQESLFEQYRFGAMTLMMTMQSCLGSIACMYILKNDLHIGFLITGAAVTMASNAFFIAQSEAKICLYAFYTSIVINFVLIITALSLA